MERRRFLRNLLFGSGLLASEIALSSKVENKDVKETYALDDLFIRCNGNDSMLYSRIDSPVNQKLMEIFGKRAVDRNEFKYYYPLFNVYLPIKEEYTIDDFTPLFMWAKEDRYNKYCNGTVAGGVEGGLFRIILRPEEGLFKVEFFAAPDRQF